MLKQRWAKVLVFVASLAPIFWLCWRAWHQNLTANPIEYITRYTGDWTIRFIVFTLAVTPLRKLLGLPDLIRFRRMIGLYAFFYGTLHFITYIWLDKFFDLPDMLKDVAKRPFITAGFTAFLLMVPLALTSTTGWIRRLGGKRWQLLHRLIYFSWDCGRGALLLAGEERHPAAGHVWRVRVSAAGLPGVGLGDETQAPARTCDVGRPRFRRVHCAIIHNWQPNACFPSWFPRTTKKSIWRRRFCARWRRLCRRIWNRRSWRWTTAPPTARRRFWTNLPGGILPGSAYSITK